MPERNIPNVFNISVTDGQSVTSPSAIIDDDINSATITLSRTEIGTEDKPVAYIEAQQFVDNEWIGLCGQFIPGGNIKFSDNTDVLVNTFTAYLYPGTSRNVRLIGDSYSNQKFEVSIDTKLRRNKKG